MPSLGVRTYEMGLEKNRYFLCRSVDWCSLTAEYVGDKSVNREKTLKKNGNPITYHK